MIHGHCHEKALIGSRYLKEALALAYPVEEIDSGCCGMAGSFGYEKEHYDISMAIGRRRLFPGGRKQSGRDRRGARNFVPAAGGTCHRP